MIIDESAVIKRIRLYEVEIPLKIPFQISGGVCYTRKSMIVELSDGTYSGFANPPLEEPYYSSETLGSVSSLYSMSI